MEKRLLVLSFAAAGLILSGASQAATTKPLEVMATVASACTLDVSKVDFGQFVGTELVANGTVIVNCNPGVAYRIGMTAGSNPDAVKNRQMSDSTGKNFLKYRLSYMDNDWGDTGMTNTTDNKHVPVNGVGIGAPDPHTVEGRIWAVSAPAPGVYSDTVMVTVAF